MVFFTLAPALVVPLLSSGPPRRPLTAAYYYVAFQLANLVFAGGYAVTQTFLAEGGHGEEELKTLTRRAARMLAITTLPACLVVAVGAPVLLDLFGRSYSSLGTDVLILMSLAAIPVAALNWLVTILRLFKQLAAVALSNGVYALAVCGLSWFLAPHGLSFVGVAWLGGSPRSGRPLPPSPIAFGSGAESRHQRQSESWPVFCSCPSETSKLSPLRASDRRTVGPSNGTFSHVADRLPSDNAA